jgi:hypothetical protein
MEPEEYLPSRFPAQDKNLGFIKYLNDTFSVLGNRQIISAGLTTYVRPVSKRREMDNSQAFVDRQDWIASFERQGQGDPMEFLCLQRNYGSALMVISLCLV